MDYYLLHDRPHSVIGVATVTSKFRGFIHSHAAVERYKLMHGTGVVHLGGKNLAMAAGDEIFIRSGVQHAFISNGPFPAKLYFEFYRGPLRTIKYEYANGQSMRPPSLIIN